jgi:hypothetical protein
MGNPMLKFRNVYQRYSSIPAVEDVSLSARADEVMGISVRTALGSPQR